MIDEPNVVGVRWSESDKQNEVDRAFFIGL
jgi:hypothetical protein